MDFEFLLIALGFILCGVIIASPIVYHIGRNSAFSEITDSSEDGEPMVFYRIGGNVYDVLEAEIVEERR